MTDSEQTTTAAAVTAFLSTPSRIMTKSSAAVVLTPQEISQKVASMLKPGPPFYSTVSSADLIDNLSNGAVMRCEPQHKSKSAGVWFKAALTGQKEDGSDAETASKTSGGDVWSALESLPSGPAAWQIPSSHEATFVATNAADQSTVDDGLWSSIMFTCDVNGEKVQLAKSCVVPTHVLNAHDYYAGNRSALFTSIGAGTTYKWDDFNTPSALVTYSQAAAALSLYTFPSVDAWTLPSWVPYFGQPKDASKPGGAPATTTPPQDKKGSKRVWVPSTEHVSVRASWWGYTIFLPQAVLPSLSADVDQAEKIANIVYKVLTTILDNAGKLPLPAALQAAVLLLKAVAPATSYISTFIGWSWDEIMSFNKGQGVELSATWLLPIALIPHTWDAAAAPADNNKDGVPDGPPAEQPTTSAPAVPAAPTPAPAEPARKEPETPDAPAKTVPTTPVIPQEPAPETSTPAEKTAPEPAESIEATPEPEQPLDAPEDGVKVVPAPVIPDESESKSPEEAPPATSAPTTARPVEEECDPQDDGAESVLTPSVKEVEENLERADESAKEHNAVTGPPAEEVAQLSPGPIVQLASEPVAEMAIPEPAAAVPEFDAVKGAHLTVQSVSPSASYDSSVSDASTPARSSPSSAKVKGKTARKLLGKITNRA